ncbi:hypothetical protein ACF1AY_10980 [Streptomyces sp. NPDC014776]|uniref:hypothetical protein n=1 Tax=unclassified Streptomyces TaxID=2593676 RepID=UPI0036F80541
MLRSDKDDIPRRLADRTAPHCESATGRFGTAQGVLVHNCSACARRSGSTRRAARTSWRAPWAVEELTKDVAPFASGRGGVIGVGITTRLEHDEEVPDHVVGLDPTAVNVDQIRKLEDQIAVKGRIVILGMHNANQAAIDDVRSIIEQHGWSDRVVWCP